MLKLFFRLLILLLLTGFQNPAEAAAHWITLDDQNLPIRNCGFQLQAVSNASGMKNAIGFVLKGVDYKKVPALFERDIKDEIRLFLDRNLETSTGQNNLIVRINELKITETYNGKVKKAIAKISITFIYEIDGRYYEQLTVSKHPYKISGYKVTAEQPRLIALAIAKCFDAFYDSCMDNKLTSKEISKDELTFVRTDYRERVNYLLNKDRSERGIYPTFYDFQEATPDVDRAFDVEFKFKKIENESAILKYVRLTDKKTGKRIDDCWGFSDGKNVYTIINITYTPLLKDKDGYFAVLPVFDNSFLTSGNYSDEDLHISPPFRIARLDMIRGIFHFDAGTIKSYRLSQNNAAPENKSLIRFFSSAYNAKSSSLDLYINNQLKCTLKKETWFAYPILNSSDTLLIKIVSNKGPEMIQSIVANKYKSDIYLIIDKKTKAPIINRVSGNTATGIEDLMKPENRIYGKDAGSEQ